MGIALKIPNVNFSNYLGTIALEGDYKVTYALTNCIVSDKPSSVNEGDSLLLTISADNAYCTISSVVITMGGVDITSSVYSNGSVNIPSCSGDIVITASAVYALPSGYTHINELVVPSGAYFDTGITPSAATSFKYTFTIDSGLYKNTQKVAHFLSCTNYYAPYCRGNYGTDKDQFLANRCGSEIAPHVELPSDYTYTVDAFNSGDKIIVNESLIREMQAGSMSPSGTLYFACYGGAPTTTKYHFAGTVNDAIVVMNNGNPIAILVPSKNGNDAVGFYDVVRGNFYTSSTSVSFTE
jgi:hypothetical protein